MADPRPTSDDPLIISGQVPKGLTQAPSTLNFGRSPFCPAAPCAPCIGCCDCLGPGCDISGPYECLPFPPCPGQGGGCSFTGSPTSLVLQRLGNQTITGVTGTVLSFDTIVHNRGFNVALCVSSVTIPRTGLWSISAKSHYTCSPPGIPCEAYLTLLKCCAHCVDFNFVIHNATPGSCGTCCTIHWPGFGFATVMTYDAGQVLKVKGNFDLCSTAAWKQSRFSLVFLGEAC